jgi:hypothetical protein
VPVRPICELSVQGGTTHTLPLLSVEGLQRFVHDFGGGQSPLFLRLGGRYDSTMQPVTSRALLAEIERFLPMLADILVPTMVFQDVGEQELGTFYDLEGGTIAAESDAISLGLQAGGLFIRTNQLPPPAGFRSRPGLKAGLYESSFSRIWRTGDGFAGERTAEMPGGAVPVALPDLPLPSVTRWHFARTAGTPTVQQLHYREVGATLVFADLLHALISACNESIRLKNPLRIRKE